jgi:murein DD-endopeptidase MepM/ murein hydrolase activator NlpD
MVSGALLLYALLWRSNAIRPPDLPGRVTRGTLPGPPATLPPEPSPPAFRSAPPSHEPGGSTDNWLRDDFGASRPGVVESATEASDLSRLQDRRLAFPVSGFDRHQLRDNFAEMRGTRVHEAVDLLAPRGTPVLAVDDGPVVKLFNSKAGGLTVYQFDRDGIYCYYYAHLDRYADGLKEGQSLARGQTLGFVGTTGNAPPGVPHLHFTIFKLGPDKHWWEGTAINPFPLWALR